jgi:hypothetical protein
MTATKLFDDLHKLTQTETLSSDSDYSETLTKFLTIVENSKSTWIKPFPQWKCNTYQTTLDGIIVHVTLDCDSDKNVVVLSKDNKFITLFANHIECLKMVVEF